MHIGKKRNLYKQIFPKDNQWSVGRVNPIISDDQLRNLSWFQPLTCCKIINWPLNNQNWCVRRTFDSVFTSLIKETYFANDLFTFSMPSPVKASILSAWSTANNNKINGDVYRLIQQFNFESNLTSYQKEGSCKTLYARHCHCQKPVPVIRWGRAVCNERQKLDTLHVTNNDDNKTLLISR